MKKLVASRISRRRAIPFAAIADDASRTIPIQQTNSRSRCRRLAVQQLLRDSARLLIDQSTRTQVKLVLHVGTFTPEACRAGAGLNPIPAGSTLRGMKHLQSVRAIDDPLVYTPGDNE